MYYEINERNARTAQEMMSFRDYVPGSATAEYRRKVDEVTAEAEKVKRLCKTEAQREKVDYLLNKYARILAEYINRENEIGTRCPSVMISGAGNFPTEKKRKQVAAWEANRETLNRAEAIRYRIQTAHTIAIASDDPEVVEALKEKIEKLEKCREEMKAANAFYRKNKTLEGCPGISAKEKEWLTRPGVFACGSPLDLYKCPFPSYSLQSVGAKIKAARERLEGIEKAREQQENGEAVTVSGNGYTYTENGEAMRVQFVFEGKPDEQTREVLKRNGFRWAPSQGAWQRQLTQNGKHAAAQVRKILDAQTVSA
mgnify:FL=1